MSLGCVRTYARLNSSEEFTYKNWIEAIRYLNIDALVEPLNREQIRASITAV